jgi:NADH dehydrogenase FAD-containing subunit
LVSSKQTILQGVHESTLKQTYRKLNEHNIQVVHNEIVSKVENDGVILSSGQKLSCNVAVWATGA